MNSKPNECLIEVKKNHEGVVLIKPLGAYLTGQAWVEKLRSVIDDIIERRKNPRVILNMSMVEHLSSSLIGELIGTYRKWSEPKDNYALQQSNNPSMKFSTSPACINPSRFKKHSKKQPQVLIPNLH